MSDGWFSKQFSMFSPPSPKISFVNITEVSAEFSILAISQTLTGFSEAIVAALGHCQRKLLEIG